MGDIRFDGAYERLLESPDRVRTLRELTPEEVVQALAAASRHDDPLLANVLATEALNRIARARAVGGALALGVAAAISLIVVVMLVFAVAEPNYPDHLIFYAVTGMLLLGALLTLLLLGQARRRRAPRHRGRHA